MDADQPEWLPHKIRPDPAEQPVLMMQDFGAPAE
jgi:hypothetical protein